MLQDQIKKYVSAAAEMEQKKQDIAESMKDLLERVNSEGINVKAFKQVVKNSLNRKDDFCPYVDALSEYTDVLFKKQ